MSILGATDTPDLGFWWRLLFGRMGNFIRPWWRSTWYTFPEIHLWCDTLAGVNCRNVKELHSSRLHWHVPFIEDLSDLVAGSWSSEEHT